MADPRNKPIARTFSIANPAVATGFTITPDTGANWLIRALTFLLTTDANAANRAVMLNITAGQTTYRTLSAIAVQAASLARTYSGSEGANIVAAIGTLIPIVFPTDGVWLPVGHTLTVSIENVQAGDQITAIQGYRFEFPLGPDVHVWPMVGLMVEESS